MFEESKEFFDEFEKIFEENSPSRKEALEKYTDNTAFTEFIIQKIQGVIEKKHNSQKEYFRIDATGYEVDHTGLDQEENNISKFNCHCWNLKIAVEHENDSKDWLDEVVKLAHVACPLRVVIGYVPTKERNTADEKLLNYTAKALEKLECRHNLQNGEFLVILGNSDTKGNERDYFNYKGYVLNSETMSFEPLENYQPKICTMCGKEFDLWDNEEDFCFDRIVGYGSAHDLERIQLNLCCDCFDKVIDWILPQCKHDPISWYDIDENGNLIALNEEKVEF